MLTEEETQQTAERLNDATKAGDLASAYAVIQPLDTDDVRNVALAAGYAIRTRKCSRPEFFNHLQFQIAEATHAKLDGFTLHGRTPRTTP